MGNSWDVTQVVMMVKTTAVLKGDCWEKSKVYYLAGGMERPTVESKDALWVATKAVAKVCM